MEKNNSVIIIGAGLSGLECGYILAKKGMDVTILEHGHQIGGYLQSFRRGNEQFDTGFHYVGGLGEGESLYPLFKYFNLLHLPWHKLDEDCFDEVYIGNKSFPFANGHERFVERLSEYFPDQRQNLIKYVTLLKNVGDHIFDAFEPRESESFYSTSLFGKSAYEFLQETITDPLLLKVISGASLKMELRKDSLPLYIFAQINDSFLQSAWRLDGGGSLIAESLAKDILSMGGRIITNATVTGMTEENGKISYVTVNGKDQYTADWIISSAHPSETLNLIGESKCIRRMYRKRITSLENTFGMFTLNIHLKKNQIKYQNKNIYMHREDADLWNPDPSRMESVLMSFYPADSNDCYADTVDLLTPMPWNQVEEWADTHVGRRNEKYLDFKSKKASECIAFAEDFMPGLANAVDSTYTSTPLTYRDYTLSPYGTAYGIRKDYENIMGTVLAPRTPIGNLLLTGQNLNLHGVLGVSMTSVISTAAIVGMNTLKTEILRNK